MSSTQHVLVPLDFSLTSLDAVNMARQLAFKTTEITLLHVFDADRVRPPASLDIAPRGDGLPRNVERRLLEALKRIREKELSSVENVKGEVVVSRFAAKGICRYAEEQLVDLIILTTHGRTGFPRLLMGSVAEEVVRQAPCPVLVVKARRAAAVRAGAQRSAEVAADVF